jgi:hypothetical protein
MFILTYLKNKKNKEKGEDNLEFKGWPATPIVLAFFKKKLFYYYLL